jgi:periplasmic protein TonB
MNTIEIHDTDLDKSEVIEVREAARLHRETTAVQPASELVLGPSLSPRPIFSDCLLEFGPQRKRKALATTTSLLFNCLVIALILAVPLMFTEELPKTQLLTFLVAPPPPPPPPPPAAAAEAQKVLSRIQTDVLNTGELRTPTRIPQKIQMIREDDAPPAMVSGGVVGGVPGGIPGGQLGGVIGSVLSSTASMAAVPKFVPATPQRVRVSAGVTKGMCIHREDPPYPPLARAARVQGDVVLTALINANGEIQNLQLVSGHPMLVPAAMAAVKTWRYKPYLLNGQPVEVETTITVIFSLQS